MDNSPTQVRGEWGLLRVPFIPCDLQNRGSYFHHATTSPHWPRNGAPQRLDWPPRLKTPFSRSAPRWRSSLACHASGHGLVCIYTTVISESVSRFDGGRKEPDAQKMCSRQMCAKVNWQQVHLLLTWGEGF